MLAEVTARTAEAEMRAREAAEARDSLVSSFDQIKADRDWMRDHGIGHIVKAILDAPENAASVEQIRLRAREDGFKAGYNRCISHINVLPQGKYTDERLGSMVWIPKRVLMPLLRCTTTCPFPPLKNLINAWMRKTMWTACGCCMVTMKRKRPLVMARVVRVPAVQRRTRLANVAFFVSSM
uniref:Uncharacterized protein n=1 Tax=Helianthus annuus TaxID=4232 RepID=A0A251U4I6_HELAN